MNVGKAVSGGGPLATVSPSSIKPHARLSTRSSDAASCSSSFTHAPAVPAHPPLRLPAAPQCPVLLDCLSQLMSGKWGS